MLELYVLISCISCFVIIIFFFFTAKAAYDVYFGSLGSEMFLRDPFWANPRPSFYQKFFLGVGVECMFSMYEQFRRAPGCLNTLAVAGGLTRGNAGGWRFL